VLRFNERNAYASSAQITMALMLAVFPFSVSVLSVAAAIGARLDPADVINLIFGTWPEVIAEPLMQEVDAVTQQSSGRTLVVGLLLAVAFASNGVDAVRTAVSAAYRDFDPRPIWATRILSVAFVLSGAILVAIVAALQVGVPFRLETMEGTPTGLVAWLRSDLVRTAVTYGLLAFGVLASHLWLPGHRQPVRTVLPGVLLTLALWTIAGYVYAYYLTNIGDYSVTYAGLAGIMATMIFLNLMAAIFILGAEFNEQLKGQRPS